MSNYKKENSQKQNSNDNINDEHEKILYHQRQEIENSSSHLSDTTKKVMNTMNEYQKTNNEILKKSIDTSSKYQQQTINRVQTMLSEYMELQNNIFNNYQSIFSKFIDDTSKSYWNNVIIGGRYTGAYKMNDNNESDNTKNVTRTINDCILGYTETFNKSLELVQKYYNKGIQNYFNIINTSEKSYNH